jgi:hypothetical protein
MAVGDSVGGSDSGGVGKMEILNQTPFVADRAVFLDKRGAERLALLLKATYSISEEGHLAVADEQDPIVAGDEFHDDPETSSITRESELCPSKPATDLFLRGRARARSPRAGQIQVGFHVGNQGVWATVFGDRVWTPSMGLPAISDPGPVDGIPLTWERAFGGWDKSPEKESHQEWEPKNPVGQGFRAKHSQLSWEDTPLPNIEDPANPIQSLGQRVIPVGFGPIGRHWKPRVDFAGTYDEKWLKYRLPLLPDDFDQRFHNAAPPALVCPGHLQGGEPVSVAGCTLSGNLGFFLPKVSIGGLVRVQGQEEVVPMNLNTVTVDTERMTLNLLWKGDVGVHGKVQEVSRLEYRQEGEPG